MFPCFSLRTLSGLFFRDGRASLRDQLNLEGALFYTRAGNTRHAFIISVPPELKFTEVVIKK